MTMSVVFQCTKIQILARMVAVVALCGLASQAHAQGTILGTGTDSLIGGDLTDPENDGLPDEDTNYNAIFSGNDEPAFGGGESAFNVFDNLLGGGNDKWCCGVSGGFPEEGLWVQAEINAGPHYLTAFTVSSANDVPNRDPTEWKIQGSNDGTTFTDIFSYTGDALWTERLQTILFRAGIDYEVPAEAYSTFRFVAFDSVNNPDGAYHQIGEIEFLGQTDPFLPGDFNSDGAIDLADFEILKSSFNESFSFSEGHSNGDATLDGIVNLQDFVRFRELFGAAGAPAAAVPEPSTWILAALGLLALTVCRKREVN